MKEIVEKIFVIANEIGVLLQSTSGKYEDGTMNESGDIQTNLDILTDKIVEKHFSQISSIKSIVSEEKEETIILNEAGKYLLAYDSLDGSSISDSNLSLGSIFGIYENDFNGKDLVAAAYILYGPRIEMVFADESGVKRFTKNYDGTGTYSRIEIPMLKEKGAIVAPGVSPKNWFKSHTDFMSFLWDNDYKLRYSGCMVPDIHQVIVKRGGMYNYPNSTTHPNGRMRKLFEMFPFSFIIEKLGGAAINHEGKRVLDLGYEDIHDVTSVYIGSKWEVEKAREFLVS